MKNVIIVILFLIMMVCTPLLILFGISTGKKIAVEKIKTECQYAPTSIEIIDGKPLIIRYYPIKL